MFCDILYNNLDSPRKILLENKEEQHKDQVFYFRNELDSELDTDKDLTKTDKTEEELFSILAEEEKKSVYQKLKEGVTKYKKEHQG